MHAFSSHRARVIAGSAHDAHPAPTDSSSKLRRQGERFRQLRMHADVHNDDVATCADMQASVQPDACPYLADAAADEQQDQQDQQDGSHKHGSGDSGQSDQSDQSGEQSGADSGAQDSGASGGDSTRSLEWFGAAQAAFALLGSGAHPVLTAGNARADAAREKTVSGVAPADAPRGAQQGAQRAIESIVEKVADFCSNPAVLARGEWHITVPLDPALLPACTLNLALSYFDLRLRFDTASEHSRRIILLHETTLRQSLEHVLQSRFETPRSIDIVVT